MGLLLTQLVGAAGSAAAGALGNTQAARTSTSNSASGGSFSNAGGVRRFLAPEQQDILSQLKSRATGQMANPGEGLAPFRASAVNAVNNAAGGVEPSLRAKFLGSGANRSGKFGRAQRLTETARLGKIADVDNQVGQMALQRGDEGSALLQRLLEMNFGSDTSASGSQDGFSNGTQVGAGNALGAGIGGGTAAFIEAQNQNLLRRLLGGG
jgi:hypothetical protein